MNNNIQKNWFQPTKAIQVVGRVYCALTAHATDTAFDRSHDQKNNKKINMAVGRQEVLATIRSELVVIGVPFTTDPHHRLHWRKFGVFLLLFTTRFFLKQILVGESHYCFFTPLGHTVHYGAW